MNKNNRNNEQIYGRNDMIMLDQNNKIYGSLGLADNYVMKTEEGTKLILSNPKLGKFGDVLTELNIYGMSKQKTTTGKNLINADEYYSQFKQSDGTYKAKTVTLNDIRISLSEFVGKEIMLSVKLTVGANISSVFLMYISSEQKRIDGSVVTSGLTGKSTLTVTPVSNTDYFVISFGSGNDDVTFSELQLELGSVATSYEPYTGGNPSPSPDYPQEIKSVVNPIVKVTNEDETESQTVTLPYTLNAIPVSSGGNVTINGQQYIADRVVEKDGVFGIERNTATDVPVLTKELRETPDMKGRFIQDGAFKKTFTPSYETLVNIGYSRKWGVAGSVIDKWILGVNKANLYISPPKNLNYTSEDIFNALKDLNIKVYGALLVPFFEPLPEDIQAKLRTLVIHYPVTIIENNYNTWMKATYKSTESV